MYITCFSGFNVSIRGKVYISLRRLNMSFMYEILLSQYLHLTGKSELWWAISVQKAYLNKHSGLKYPQDINLRAWIFCDDLNKAYWISTNQSKDKSRSALIFAWSINVQQIWLNAARQDDIEKHTIGRFYFHGLTSIPAWIKNSMPDNTWDKIHKHQTL